MFAYSSPPSSLHSFVQIAASRIAPSPACRPRYVPPPSFKHPSFLHPLAKLSILLQVRVSEIDLSALPDYAKRSNSVLAHTGSDLMNGSGVQNERHGRSLGSRVCLTLLPTGAFHSSQATPLIMTRCPCPHPMRAFFRPYRLSIF